MPAYEMTMILRKMAKPELTSALKRMGEYVLKNGAILRYIQNLGTKELPLKMSRHGRTNWHGSYFLFRFDASPELTAALRGEIKRDVDIIRATFITLSPPKTIQCTLEKEMQPPAYRPSVQALMAQSQVKKKQIFEKHTDGPV
ncbi:small ribosomal subunit protein bS6m [Dermacentor andersoni]|uniref:small ribosomal subunit protein bS6m n=2 Tax=Dermacentor TaxID=34619 RepID=UPI002155E988|nr:probable 28S ribosomal protein S6, mitochondrial [Dermacentor andersoni]